MLTKEESYALSNFAAHGGALLSAIDKFNAWMRAHTEANCADAMRSVPRQHELAADYAAKAEAYKTWLADLERFSAGN